LGKFASATGENGGDQVAPVITRDYILFTPQGISFVLEQTLPAQLSFSF
jgi:hypothetical protein